MAFKMLTEMYGSPVYYCGSYALTVDNVNTILTHAASKVSVQTAGGLQTGTATHIAVSREVLSYLKEHATEWGDSLTLTERDVNTPDCGGLLKGLPLVIDTGLSRRSPHLAPSRLVVAVSFLSGHRYFAFDLTLPADTNTADYY